MATWLAKMLQAIGGEGAGRQVALEKLVAAQRARTRLNLEVVSGSNTVVLASTIEQVRSDDFIISQPTIGGLTHPLAFGEIVTVGFTLDSNYHSGKTQCLGRVRIPAGNNGAADSMLYAYRLATPESLEAEERRTDQRAVLNFDDAVEAQLYAPFMIDGPIFGRIADVSASGARIVTQMPAKRIERGQSIYLKTKLPEPAGMIDDLVIIAHVDTSRNGECTIGVQFRKRVPGVEHLLRRSARQLAA